MAIDLILNTGKDIGSIQLDILYSSAPDNDLLRNAHLTVIAKFISFCFHVI
jgi:hypothetical protein